MRLFNRLRLTEDSRCLADTGSLVLLLLVTVLKGLLWSSIVPIWHAPDEPGHFEYAQAILRTGTPLLPPLSELPLEVQLLNQMMQIDRVAFNRQATLDFRDSAGIEALKMRLQDRNCKSLLLPSPPVYLTVYHPPLYYILGAATLSLVRGNDILTQMALLRLLSVLCGTLAVLFAYLAIRLLLPGEPIMAVGVAALVSFQPMITMNTATVTNHALEICLFTVALWLMVRTARQGLTWENAVALGATVGLASLTRISFLALLPPLALLALWNLFRGRQKTPGVSQTPGVVLRWLALLILAGTLASFWYGQPFRAADLGPRGTGGEAASISLASIAAFLQSYDWGKYLDLFGMYWAIFGWNDTILPYPVYYAILAFCLAALVGWFVRLERLYLRPGVVKRPAAWQVGAMTLLSLAALSLVLEFIPIEYLRLQKAGVPFYIQGRYYLAAIVAQMLLLTLGLTALVPRSWRGRTVATLVTLMVVLNSACLALAIIPRYYYPLDSPGRGQTEVEVPAPAGELIAGKTIGQTFLAEENNLCRIDAQLATYGRRNSAHLRFHLQDNPASDHDIATVSFNTAEVVDDAYQSFTFPPQANSAGHNYYFFLDSPDGEPGDAITVRSVATGPDRYPQGNAYIDGQPTSGDLTFIPYYKEGLPLLLKRLATLQPGFYTPAFFVVSASLYILALLAFAVLLVWKGCRADKEPIH
jgi:4-amino-4-deoxy-L-arabinose transferase-like glycosyltransferase